MKVTKNVYTIFDTVSKQYVGLFYHSTDEDMIRTTLPSILMDYPLRDIQIVCIGTFDDVKGVVHSVKVRRTLSTSKYLFPHSRLSSKGDDLSLDELDKGMKESKANAIANLSSAKNEKNDKDVVNE